MCNCRSIKIKDEATSLLKVICKALPQRVETRLEHDDSHRKMCILTCVGLGKRSCCETTTKSLIMNYDS